PYTTLFRSSFQPRYSWVKSAETDRIDISSITLPLQATYRLTAWMAAVARYQFYQQRTGTEVRDSAGNLLAADADQNRLFVGLQFGYPITFDRPSISAPAYSRRGQTNSPIVRLPRPPHPR